MESGIKRRAAGQMIKVTINSPKAFELTLEGRRKVKAKMPVITPIATATPKITHFVCWRWTGVDTRL